MYRKMLIPASEPSEVEPLIRFASSLLDADGEIRLLHVIPTTTLPEVTRQWRASVNMVVPAHEAGAALDIRVDPEVRASVDVAGEILESAETHQVDAILMTLQGSRRSRNPFLGHTATSVIHHAPCDVLIVNRLALLEEGIPRVLVPTFAAQAPARAMRVAEEIGLRHRGIPIVTLHLGARGDGSEASLGPSRSPRGLPLAHRRSVFPQSLLGRRRRLPELILQQASRERYGLLIVGQETVHEGPLLTRRFLEELFRNAPCPVLAIRG